MRTYVEVESMKPCFRSFCRVAQDDPGCMRKRYADVYELSVYLKDGGETAINAVAYPIRQYDISFLRPGDAIEDRSSCARCSILFDFGPGQSICENELLDQIPPMFHGPKEAARLFERVERAMERNDAGRALMLRVSILELLLLCYDAVCNSRSYSQVVLTCINYIKANFGKEITLEELGKLTDYSPAHLMRLFKREMNMTPHAYLTRVRLAHAKELLVRTDYTLSKISVICGFESDAHFQRLFKRYMEMTPGSYRKQAQMNRM